MAYTKTTWNCGDEISAERMNNIEDGIEEALACCGGGDVGYECTETLTTAYDGNVTTAYDNSNCPYGNVTGTIFAQPGQTAKITFNGTEYILPDIGSGAAEYGAPYNESDDLYDFSEYPFNIYSYSENDTPILSVATQNEGTFAIKVEFLFVSVSNIAPCFSEAVKQAIGFGLYEVNFDFNGTQPDKTFAEVYDAIQSGKPVVGVLPYGTDLQVFHIARVNTNSIRFTSVEAESDNKIVVTTITLLPNDTATKTLYFSDLL